MPISSTPDEYINSTWWHRIWFTIWISLWHVFKPHSWGRFWKSLRQWGPNCRSPLAYRPVVTEIKCNSVQCTLDILPSFSPKNVNETPHSSPVRAIYWVSLNSLKSDQWLCRVVLLHIRTYALLCYSKPRQDVYIYIYIYTNLYSRDIFCLKNFDTFTRTPVHVSKMNAVARAQLTFQIYIYIYIYCWSSTAKRI